MVEVNFNFINELIEVVKSAYKNAKSIEDNSIKNKELKVIPLYFSFY